MEDADRIIVEHLQQLGCDFEVESMKDFDAEKTLEAVVKLLKAIIPDFSAPTSVPHNMVAKYNIGMKLADAITSLGFKGDLGYQSFLYSNEVELRRIFGFLIEKLPKDEKPSPAQSTGSKFKKALASVLRSELDKPWLPLYARPATTKRPFQPITVSTASEIVQITDRHIFIATILHANASLRAKLTRPSKDEFARLVEVIQDKKAIPALQKESSMPEDAQDQAQEEVKTATMSENSEDVAAAVTESTPNPEQELELMDERRFQLDEELQEVDMELDKVTSEMVNVQLALEEVETLVEGEKHADKLRSRAEELIVERGADGAMEFCNEYLTNLQAKSVKLATEWEEHRRPLVDQLRRLRQENTTRWGEQRSRRERIERLDRERQRMIQEYSLKKELVKQLQAEWDKLSAKDANVTQCSSYLTRIREIVSSVARQREEIEKILVDNRKQQREMNLLSDRLERTFAAAEIFFTHQSSRIDDAKRVHRHIIEIHKDCKSIFEAVEATGTIQREIRDLEERIDKERESKVVENLARITADFNQMKMENDAIERELTKKGVIIAQI